ncbi:MAG: type II methionyl aminopeptidase, partial [archaeon]
FAKEIIKPNMKLIEIAEAIDTKIFELGGEPAFPVNLSLNEIAAHYTPAPGDETVAEGILKVDIGVAVDGYIADTAFSVDLTEGREFKEIIELNEKILEEATKKVRVGMEVREIGEACQNTLEEWNEKNNSNFSIIKNLSGHSLGQDEIHAGLTISNYKNDNRAELSGAFAIEPFVTTGVGKIYEGQFGGIYVLQSDAQVRDRDAREVLKFIKENFVTRPFCLRWLVGDEELGVGLTENKLKFILAMLVKQGILYEYPMLIEKSKAPVSQFENTFVIADGKVLCTTG